MKIEFTLDIKVGMPAELLSQPFVFKVELLISTVRTVVSISLGGSSLWL